MGHISTESVGDILDHLADVIEGGNAYASGSSMNGIPGRGSNDQGLRTGSDGSVTASSGGTTTTIPYASGDWTNERWVKANTPGYFALSTSGDNEGEARRITAWDNTGKEFTTDAFSNAVPSGGTFTILQGFKRLPDQIDIEQDDGPDAGWDRFFRLSVESEGEEVDFYGKGLSTRRAELQLRLRLLKYHRDRSIRASAFENMSILRDVLTRGDQRDSTYIRGIIFDGGTDVDEDEHKVVATQTFALIYRVNNTFK